MKKSSIHKLEALIKRYKKLKIILNNPNVFSNREKFRELSKEYGQLHTLSNYFERWIILKKNINDTEFLLQDSEMYDIAKEDLQRLNIDRISLEKKLQYLLTTKYSESIKSCFLEIRAGTGGNEAAFFTKELFRMYSRYAEKYRWKIDIINISNGEQGGYKEVIARFSHIDAYKRLKFESGGHRVQRVPNTESQGRVHTSSCTVAVIPEIPSIELPPVRQNDLRIDTFRSSGAGGQHVNTTDSAIRITHIPTGIVVVCQDERSQHKNKSRALEILYARLSAIQSKEREKKTSLTRKNLLGSGDRSDRIRTYNFHQSRVTDHRLSLSVYSLNEIIEGNLDILIQPIIDKYESN